MTDYTAAGSGWRWSPLPHAIRTWAATVASWGLAAAQNLARTADEKAALAAATGGRSDEEDSKVREGAIDSGERLQEKMRRDEAGRLVCERCGKLPRWGWVFQWGSIILATCERPTCWPRQAGWVRGVQFTRRAR